MATTAIIIEKGDIERQNYSIYQVIAHNSKLLSIYTRLEQLLYRINLAEEESEKKRRAQVETARISKLIAIPEKITLYRPFLEDSLVNGEDDEYKLIMDDKEEEDEENWNFNVETTEMVSVKNDHYKEDTIEKEDENQDDILITNDEKSLKLMTKLQSTKEPTQKMIFDDKARKWISEPLNNNNDDIEEDPFADIDDTTQPSQTIPKTLLTLHTQKVAYAPRISTTFSMEDYVISQDELREMERKHMELMESFEVDLKAEPYWHMSDSASFLLNHQE